MFISRRILLLLTAAGLATTATVPTVAQTWPTKSITFIVPFPAGGGTDTFARPIAVQLEQQLGQRIIIDNRGGAGGTVGASAASKAAPDGYTFFVGAAHHAIAPALYPKLDYNIEKDFIPVGVIAQPPQVIVVNPKKVEAKTLAELIAFAKANPDKLNYASAGNGTTHHLAGELFKLLAKAPLTHVPYRGAGPAMQDLVAGQVDVMFDGLGSSAAQISGGTLRALAVAAPTRSEVIATVPTAKEAGLDGYDVATWYAIWATKGTPPDIVARMRSEVAKALKAQLIVDVWQKNGSPIPDIAGDEFGKFVTAEVARWGAVVKDANVKLD
ncbi:tripartite tricarboxylate transporter substrate binding protein [Bosea sp. 685]|uniref:Bug family tripartite tricarboxylate transporter substrate binding protein n=1 Tax=Bosea sp. 685 TaxID=3080057 RepID=UPI0028937E18|nr:tripartite tricarboxylate transporter substrate binding protein [Bosea sp. 685]WNJ93426.1 tripartite tricarboxylate transporter substrate binding protein [Bosea sp. 685]